MLLFTEARQAALIAMRLIDEGVIGSLISRIIQAEYPLSNGFERNRAISRGTDMWTYQTAIRFGSLPGVLTLPYPLPPSSTPPNPPLNRITLDITVLVERPAMPDIYRIARATGVSGDTYMSFTDQHDAIIASWQARYPTYTFTITDPCRTMF